MPPGVEDRNADVWEPLLAIADAVGWAQEARSAAVELIGAARDAEPSLGIRLLADVRTLFDASTLDPLPTATILSRLIELPESPWGDLKGKPINDRTLAGGSANTGSSRKRFGSETRPPWGTPARTCSTCGSRNGHVSCSGRKDVPESCHCYSNHHRRRALGAAPRLS